MIRFLFKGLLRDRQRSLLPIIVVAAGVSLTVLMVCYLAGVLGDFIDFSAKFSTGHVKIMTHAYAENSDQVPTDLALTDVNSLLNEVQADYPDMDWVLRIQFGGLLDVPDENGETRSQGTVMGISIDMLTPGSKEPERLTLEQILVHGEIPDSPGEILISDDLANNLEVSPGDAVTLMSSTMYGSMAFYNFIIAGTVRFGTVVMDKGAIIADISDVQTALDMYDASSEILGYLPDGYWDAEQAEIIKMGFNSKFSDPEDEFSPVMSLLNEEGLLAGYLEMIGSMSFIMVFVFVLAMSIVLWNTGLIGGLRRYGEVGIRLAIGEEKGHIYRSMIWESLLIGIVGSAFGTIVGLLFSYWLQEVGIDISSMTQGATMMMPGSFHAKIIPSAYYIGFIPGLIASTAGTMLSGIGIYKRQTAVLFKELET
ncbi:MAG: FtsX-like permease family protein [Bacteroidales bacterium]|nr:FtsX-like permease family protein [Bacteroidales bacterium]